MMEKMFCLSQVEPCVSRLCAARPRTRFVPSRMPSAWAFGEVGRWLLVRR